MTEEAGSCARTAERRARSADSAICPRTARRDVRGQRAERDYFELSRAEGSGDRDSLCVSKSNLPQKDDVRRLPAFLRSREAYHLAATGRITESCHWCAAGGAGERTVGEAAVPGKVERSGAGWAAAGWDGTGWREARPAAGVGGGSGRGVTHSTRRCSQEVAGHHVKMAPFPAEGGGGGAAAAVAAPTAGAAVIYGSACCPNTDPGPAYVAN